MNFLQYYNLKEDPFSPSPDEKFYFPSQEHEVTLRKLKFCIDWKRGFAITTGGVGTGKTTLCRRLLEIIPDDRYILTHIIAVSPEENPSWFLKKILYEIGSKEDTHSLPALFGALYNNLIKLKNNGKRLIILIDEAQLFLTRGNSEILRGLLNLEIPGEKLLTLLLFGMPNIERFLESDESLRQRIGVRCTLHPFDEETTMNYIKHRVLKAGAQKLPFTYEAVRTIHRYSRGIPRLINIISGNSLFEGSFSNINPITSRFIVKITMELGLSIEEIQKGTEVDDVLNNGKEGGGRLQRRVASVVDLDGRYADGTKGWDGVGYPFEDAEKKHDRGESEEIIKGVLDILNEDS